MGSLLYDYLTESPLFEEALYDDDFGEYSDDQLRTELDRYRDFCLKNLSALTDDAINGRSILRVFAGVGRVDIATLKQSALYIHQHVVPDPLFPFTEARSNMADAMGRYLGVPGASLDRRGLVGALQYLKQLTPMVAANYVKPLPISLVFEAPKELPIYSSDNCFSDLLPPDRLAFFHKHAKVTSLHKTNGGWAFEDHLRIGRAISVEFTGDETAGPKVYFLFKPEFSDFDDAARTCRIGLHLPDEDPLPEEFSVWVTQSVNRAASDVYGTLRTQVRMGRQMGASFITTSALHGELLTRYFPYEQGTETCTANAVLNVDLPFIDNIATDVLMKVRTEDGEVFENFRNELDKQLYDLRFETDPVRLKTKAAKVFHDLGTVQTHALQMKANDLLRGSLAQAIVWTATLAGGLVASGMAPLAPVAALAGLAKVAADYRAALRSNPAFFLWKCRRS